MILLLVHIILYFTIISTLLLADDVDGDEVRCRWARYFSEECSGVCSAFPGAILDEVL